MHSTLYSYAHVSAENLEELKAALHRYEGLNELKLDEDDAFEQVESVGIDYVNAYNGGEEQAALDEKYAALCRLKLPNGEPMFIGDDEEEHIFHFSPNFSEKDELLSRLDKAKEAVEKGESLYSIIEGLGLTDEVSRPAIFSHGSVEDGILKASYAEGMAFDRMLVSPYMAKDGYFIVAQAFDYHF